MDRGRPVALIEGHRPDVEGLRAVAVIAVLLYHAGVPGLGGGYVGVDVFFAVSGYLMTALLVTERWRTGTISFRSFYARRARRLLPASVTVLLVTLAVARFVLPPLAFERTAGDIAAAGGYVVNLRFAREATDYLGDDVAASPVLHYWSLAVEEQFYLVWPILLGLALGRSARRSGPVVVLAVVAAASFALSVVWTAEIQPWAFFSLPTRAWEFAVGGLAAFWTPARRTARSAVVGWVGLVAVVGSIVGFGESTRFPGPSAAIPVIGTVLVLAAGGRGPAVLLDVRVFQWIGRHSYGLYLWHWPPLVLLPVLLDRDLRLVESLGVVAGSFVVAAIALRTIEDPVRFAAVFAGAPWRSAVLASALTVAAVATPWVIRSTVDTTGSGEVASIDDVVIAPSVDVAPHGGLPDGDDPIVPDPTAVVDFGIGDPVGPTPVPSNLTPSLAEVGDDEAGDLREVGCHVDQLATEPMLPCAYGDLDGDVTVVLFGDSHMAQWFPAFEGFAGDLGIRIVSLTKSACPSADKQVYNTLYDRPYDECEIWRDATIDAISDIAPDVVVLGNYPRAGQVAAVVSTIERLEPSGAAVFVLGPTPIPSSEVPDCVSAALDDTRPCDLDRSVAAPAGRRADESDAVARAGAVYLDPIDWFCGPTVCPAVLGEFLVYRDGSHVATPYMEWLSPNLRSAWRDLGLPVGAAAS
jgi:peptidoglycan/LPS O-acetylase OafA/YrhL